jgi:hypothetical protein
MYVLASQKKDLRLSGNLLLSRTQRNRSITMALRYTLKSYVSCDTAITVFWKVTPCSPVTFQGAEASYKSELVHTDHRNTDIVLQQ